MAGTDVLTNGPTSMPTKQPSAQPAPSEAIPTVALALDSASALLNMTLTMMPDPTKQPAELAPISYASLNSFTVTSASATASLDSALLMDTAEMTMMVHSTTTTSVSTSVTDTTTTITSPPTANGIDAAGNSDLDEDSFEEFLLIELESESEAALAEEAAASEITVHSEETGEEEMEVTIITLVDDSSSLLTVNESTSATNPPIDETVVGLTEGISDSPTTVTIQDGIATPQSSSPSSILPNNDDLANKTSYLLIASTNGNPIKGSNHTKSSSMIPVVVCATLAALSALVVVALLVAIRKRRQDSQGFDGDSDDGIEDDIEAHINRIDEDGHENFEISLGHGGIDSQLNTVIEPDTSYFANDESQQYQQQQQHEYQYQPSTTISTSSSSNNNAESSTIASSSSSLNQNWWLRRSISNETDETPIASNVTAHGTKNAIPPRSFNLMDDVIDEEDGSDELE